MNEVMSARQFVADFVFRNKNLMGELQAVQMQDGRNIDLSNMTDEEAKEVAEMFMGVGNPTRLGALAK